MYIQICPFCKSSEFVSVLKSGKRAFCENCEKSFELGENGISPKRKNLKLFLSYPHTPEGEYNICNDITACLKGRGHDVWFDQDQLGGHHGVDWRRKIAEGIEDSQLVVSCLNRHAVRVKDGRRGVCLDELSIAISVKGGNINTVLLEPEKEVKPSAALSHRQWLDMSAWKEKYASGEAVYGPWLKLKLEELVRMVESEENYTFDGEITRIAKKLGMTNYRMDKRELLNKPFVGREWLAREVDRWIENNGKMCAIYGDPGVGKSTFAVQYAFSSPHVGAIICFEYGNPHYNSVPVMVRAIAYQLACRMSDYRGALLDILEQPGMMELSDAELFDQLLIKPLRERHIDGNQENICVILDGLDECGEGERNATAEVLGRMEKRFPDWIRVIVTSRREAAVLAHIAPDKIIELRGTDEKNLEDIRNYYMQALADKIPERERRSRIAETLAARCEGSFLYAYLAAEAIHAGVLDPEDEFAYPGKLGQMLTLWMERLFPDPKEYRDHFRLPIGMILASPEPLPEEELERLADMSETDVRDLKRRIKVFMKEGTDDFRKKTLSFEHRYIRDWICSEEAYAFSVSQKDALKALARGCYRVFSEDAASLSGYESVHIFDLLENTEMKRELNETLLSGELFKCLEKQGDWLSEWSMYLRADRIYRNMIRNAQRRNSEWETAETKRDLMISWSRRGKICEIYGRLDEALDLYQKALAISEALAEELSTPEARSDLSESYINVAVINRKKGRLDEALDLFQKGMEISGNLAEELNTPEALRDLSYSYNNVAGIYKLQGRLDEALDLYQKNLAITEKLAEELNTPTALRDLSYSYNNVASVYKVKGQPEEALDLFQKGLAISEKLADELKTPEARRDLSYSYNNVAGICKMKGRPEEALELYRKNLGITESLAEELNTPEARRDLSYSYNNIAGICQDLGRTDEALSLYRKALIISEALAEELNTPEARRDLSISYNNVAGICGAGCPQGTT